MTLATSTKKHVGVSFATQYFEMTIHFLAVLVLARLLTPEDIGTFSVAAFLMAFLHMFRDFGVVQYLIQEHDLTNDKIRSAMGVSIILALAVAAILLASSGFLGRFYSNPVIEKILIVMSASFAISPFGSMLSGIFRRNMQLKSIFITRITSALCHVTVAITLAVYGLGAMSLAWANFAGILSFGIIANLLRPKGMPKLPRFNNIKTVLSFGGISSVGNAANMAGTNMPDLVIGKVMSMASVGYFSRATGLIQLFTKLITSALNPLVLPYFSQLRREGKDFSAPYLLAVEHLTALAWPFFIVMMLLAQPIIRTLYGTQWDASVPLVELLCLAGCISSISLFATQVMVANGQVKNSTYAQLIALPFRVGAVLYASLYDLKMIAISLIVSELIALVIISWFLNNTIKVGPLNLLKATQRSALVALSSSIIPLMINIFWTGDPAMPWLPLTMGILGAAAGWISGIFVSRHPLAAQIMSLKPLDRLTFLNGQIRNIFNVANLKINLKKFAYQIGILGIFHRIKNRSTLTVSMFHRVLPSTDPRHAGADPEWTMSPENFKECLSFFHKHYNIVSPNEVFAALRGEIELPSRSLLITFDDGWADTATYANPILKQFSDSALIFIAGGAINQAQPFWEERVFSFLATQPDGPNQLITLLHQKGADIDIAISTTLNEPDIRDIIDRLGKLDTTLVKSIVENFSSSANEPPAMLNTEEVAQLVTSKHIIGGHGMTHQPLTQVDKPEYELKNSHETISAFLKDFPIKAMSFPHGAYSSSVIAQARSAGYQFLFSSDAHLHALGENLTKQNVIGRIHISERAISDSSGQFIPSLLATWLFLRPIKGAI
jgi:O-antigen/teichoic acid export membrane protein/peptidoglycan/xylan/chitin deacetylase (PgdA/CDA1 family)